MSSPFDNTAVAGLGVQPRFVDKLTYRAAESSNKRKAPRVRTASEDHHLKASKRKAVTATSRDAVRNFAIAQWAIQSHLDYVSAFSFQSKTGDEVFDAELEQWVKNRGAKERFHNSGRHSIKRATRMSEGRRMIDGDIGWLRTEDGTISFIESDLITEKGVPSDGSRNWVNGVDVDGSGKARAYSKAYRKNASLAHDTVIQAENLYLHAQWDSSNRFDQVRGISPMTAALNTLRDIDEGFDLALAKVKVGQMFGLKFTKGEDEDTGEDDGDDTDDAGTPSPFYLDGGPFQVELGAGEDADFLESKTPATETTNFLKLMVHVALKAVGIPYSFFDESHTNFFGSRGALLHYLRRCDTPIGDNQECLNWWTWWAIAEGVIAGEITLPRSIEFGALQFEWVSKGVPWWDVSKEIRGNSMAVAGHFDNIERICKSTGTDAYENLRINAKFLKAAEAAGAPVILAGVNPDQALKDAVSEAMNDG